jgi:transcriptional regulator with XRE-family HTH domain
MGKLQIIKTPTGEELVVLPRSEYEALKSRRSDSAEDVASRRIFSQSAAAIRKGREIELPATVAERIARGENPIRVVREWRGLTQLQLGEMKAKVDGRPIGQGYLSQLERDERKGTAMVLKALARALKVPLELLLPD